MTRAFRRLICRFVGHLQPDRAGGYICQRCGRPVAP